MENDIVIQAGNLTKTYKLYDKHSNRVKEAFHPFRKKYHTTFNALTDLSFSIRKGDTVGLIGRNGSGKSTLLQVICGIVEPTSGVISVCGRISALLELGAGFNPEFTGRENVYLNASIMGMSKQEIDACYDQIAEFADIGSFIDQPVKTYSSGMYVRLAFAVAINVNPDILIVDEALSVGDTLFQVKCFAKFREFQEKGVTIVFVTHSVDLVTRYCNKGYLLERGRFHAKGDVIEVVDEYNRLLVNCSKKSRQTQHRTLGRKAVGWQTADPLQDSGSNLLEWEGMFKTNPQENRYGNGGATILEAGIFDQDGNGVQTMLKGQVYEFRMRVIFHKQLQNPVFAYTIKDIKGFDITGTNTLYQDIETGTFDRGEIVTIIFRHKMILGAGGYLLSFGCAGFEDDNYVIYERRYDYMTFEVISEKPNVGFLDLESVISLTRHPTV